MPRRASLIFGITTESANRAAASPHSGSWSENLWDNTGVDLVGYLRELAQKRALMLPKQAAVIGYRIASYTLSGNRLTPGGTSSGRFLYPGRPSIDCDMPQVALQLSLAGASGNTSRLTLRGMPDDVITKGEYQPDADFTLALNEYFDKLLRQSWGFMGRNLTNPTGRIVSVAGNGACVIRGGIGLAEGDYVRALHITDDDGKPVTGVFRVGPVTGGGTTFTLANWPNGITVTENGSLRKDEVAFVQITSANFSRAVVRKIGSPSERYRGRASKRTR